jgi:F-type H+-transporting ATPase subunit a
MSEASVAHAAQPELPDIVTLLLESNRHSPLAEKIFPYREYIYSLSVIFFLSWIFIRIWRRRSFVPGRLQASAEVFVSFADDFCQNTIGHQGRRFLPFIGTLFIYIFFMNIMSLIPFMKPATSDWSITLALGICVFCYVQYVAFTELGIKKYIDHLAGKPRGALAMTIIFPIAMFFIHVFTELIKPLTLSLRLRSNVWGEDMLLAIFAGFGLKGLPFLFFGMCISLLASVIQAGVFSILTAVYFALFLTHDD